jgi:hypothetical protein
MEVMSIREEQVPGTELIRVINPAPGVFLGENRQIADFKNFGGTIKRNGNNYGILLVFHAHKSPLMIAIEELLYSPQSHFKVIIYVFS